MFFNIYYAANSDYIAFKAKNYLQFKTHIYSKFSVLMQIIIILTIFNI